MHCPCGKSFVLTQSFGVSFYIHEEDKSECKMLNSFSVDAKKIFFTLLKQKNVTENINSIVTFLRSSSVMRAAFFEYLEKERDEKKLYISLCRWHGAFTYDNDRYSEIFREFGDTAIENFTMIGFPIVRYCYTNGRVMKTFQQVVQQKSIKLSYFIQEVALERVGKKW